MSARGVLHRAVLAALARDPVLTAEAAILGEPAATPACPNVTPEELLFTEWGTKTAAGREARGAVTIRDVAAGAERARRMTDAVEGALSALPRTLEDGWTCGGAAVLRSRVVRERGREGDVPRWLGSVEFRVRMLREEGDE